jgi:hypothetical protein
MQAKLKYRIHPAYIATHNYYLYAKQNSQRGYCPDDRQHKARGQVAQLPKQRDSQHQ